MKKISQIKFACHKRLNLFISASALLASLVTSVVQAENLLDEMQVPDTCGTTYADKLATCAPFRCTKPSPMAMMFGFPSREELQKMSPERRKKMRASMAAAEKKMQSMSSAERATMKAKMVSTLEIKGYNAQHQCQVETGMSPKYVMQCAYDAPMLKRVSDYERIIAKAEHVESDSSGSTVNGKWVAKSVTKVDGKVIDNPLVEAMNKKICKTLKKDADRGRIDIDQLNRMAHIELNLSEHGKHVAGHVQILNTADGKVLFDNDVATDRQMREINLKPGTFDIKVVSMNAQLPPVWFRGVKLGVANVFRKNVEFYAISGTLKLTVNVEGQPTNMAIYINDPETHERLFPKASALGKESKFYFKSASIMLPESLTGRYEVFATPIMSGFKPARNAKYKQFLLTIHNSEVVEKTIDFGKTSQVQAPVEKVTGNAANTLFILDASGSMWGQINGKAKITIAKEVMAKLVPELSVDSRVGLIAYGHRRKADCNDVEVLVKLGSHHNKAVLSAVKGLSAKGKTPLTRSVNRAFKMLQQEKQQATIILVSDGIESCNQDPCKTVAAAKKYGVNFVLHTVGFGLSKAESEQLKCMANAGGGQYFQANNAKELLNSTRKALQPMGGIKITAKVNGKVTDVMLKIVDVNSGKVVYENVLPSPSGMTTRLLAGKYNITVKPGGVSGAKGKLISNFEIGPGQVFNKTINFGKGRLKLTITRDGKAVHASIHIEEHASHQWVYQSSVFGVDTPITVDLPAGKYDIVFQADAPEKRLENIMITARKTVVKNIPADVKPVNTRADKNSAYQLNTDLPGGGDFAHTIPASDNAKLCQQACMQKKQCRSWTYVKPNTIQGASPNCWLKQGVPAAVPNNCCTSGVK